jgi:hypothetical protein
LLVGAPLLAERAAASTPTAEQQAAIAAAQKAALDPEAPNGQADHDTALGHKLESGSASAGPVDQTASLAAQSKDTGGTYVKALNLPTNITLPGVPGTSPVRAYHIIPDPRSDNFLLVAGSGNDANTFAAGTFAAFIWTPFSGITRH